MPLRLRLALLFALATAALITVAGLVFVLQLRVSVDASLDPGLRGRVADIADELSSREPLPTASADEILQLATLDGRLVESSARAGPVFVLDAEQLQRAVAGEVSYTGWVAGDRSRVLATTLSVPDGSPFAAGTTGGPLLIAVGTGTDVSEAAVGHAIVALALGGPPAVLLAGVGAWLLAGAVLRPVERMRRQAAEISDHDLGRRLPVPATRDEVAALGETVNGLLARLQEALERERAFVADAGHELRTPLSILRTELELAARPGRTREALVEAVAAAGQETDRLIRLAEDLLLLARADDRRPFLRLDRVSATELVAAAARGAQSRAADRGVRVAVRGDGAGGAADPRDSDFVLWADPDRLRQAVDNLLDNATRHAPAGSVVEVALSRPRHEVVAIEVADHGPGFPPEFLPRAFDRFERADSARTRDAGGTGLGLSIVRAITEAHGGRVAARNRPGDGASVIIELPDPTGGQRAAAATAHGAPAPGTAARNAAPRPSLPPGRAR